MGWREVQEGGERYIKHIADTLCCKLETNNTVKQSYSNFFFKDTLRRAAFRHENIQEMDEQQYDSLLSKDVGVMEG